jgi:hypothetical protein
MHQHTGQPMCGCEQVAPMSAGREGVRRYAERDIVKQGQPYFDHVSAMTVEGLHAKSAIAAELAHRDIEIATLTAELGAMREALQRIAERPRGHHDCDDYSRGYGQCKADMANIADRALSSSVPK